MAEISRRTLITSVGVGAGALAIGGGALLWASQNKSSTAGSTGREPAILSSSNGALTVDLVASYSEVKLGDTTAKLKTYNGTSPGPTLVVWPGDVITVNFTNKLGEPTNLHMHGFHVSPMKNSDNVFVEIGDGETFTYVYRLDENHPSGPFWYHPHHHGMAADQVFAGLYGAVVVKDSEPIHSVTERVFVLSDIALTSNGTPASPGMMARMMGREGNTLLVNGQPANVANPPVYQGKTTSRERWRIVNASTSRYMSLAVSGATAHMLGMDAGRYSPPKQLTSVTLAPGNRVDLLVDIANKTASLTYTSVAHEDSMGMGNAQTFDNFPLLSVVPTGEALIGLADLPTQIPGVDLRKLAASTKRTFTLAMPAMGSGMMGNMNGDFTINGVAFDHHAVNTTTTIGAIEEWTIINTSTMAHPFHLHVWPMQVLSEGATRVTGIEYQDVVNVPARSQSVVRVHFDAHPGKAVYHCHILDHEDLGMMAIIEVK